MDNQSITNPSDSTLNDPLSAHQPTSPMKVKTSLVIPIILSMMVCAVIFGLGGYYYGKQSSVVSREDTQQFLDVSPQLTQVQQVTPVLSVTAMVIPTTAPNLSKALTYSLPIDWKTLTDTNGRLDVGYDATRYDASVKENQVNLSGKFVGTQGSDLRRLGGTKNFYLTTYDGGSRHTNLYKILDVTPATSDWKSPKNYSEKEYSYNGWSCLVIDGIDISQYPVAWSYCPISNNEALVMAFDSYDWSEIEQQISAVRLLQ